MKKIHFIIMAIALVFSGCTTEEIETPFAGEKMVKIRISTVNPPEIVGTRTMLDENLDVKWHTGDEIIMVAQNPEGGEMLGRLTNVYEDGYEGLFEGEVPKAWVSNTTIESAVYSYKTTEWATANGYTVSAGDWGRGFSYITLPSQQPMVPGTFARDCNLSAATFELNDDVTQVYFHNLCGLLRVSLKGNADIKSMKITAPSKINGSFSLNTNYHVGRETEYTLILADKGSSDNVTLMAEEKIGLTSEPQNFYACVLPENIKVGSVENAGPGAGEYQIAVTTVEGKVVTKTVSVEKGIAAGRYADLGELEVNYTFADVSEAEFDPTGESVELKYLPSGGDPAVGGVPEWIQYAIADGRIVFTAGMYVGDLVRTADITITQGNVSSTVTFSQHPVQALKLKTLYCDADAHADYEVEKTEYLTGEYTFETSGWLSAVVNDAGNALVSISANGTAVERTGEIRVKIGDNVVGTLTVIQTGFNYVSLAGDYNFDFWQRGYYRNEAQNRTVTLSADPDGRSYKMLIGSAPSDQTRHSMKLTYTPIGSNPSFLSLICLQDTEQTNIYSGWSVKSKAHVAKKNEYNTTGVNNPGQNGIRIDDEGTGYDLVYSAKEAAICFDFVPNALTQELYPEGVRGLCYPGTGSREDRDDIQLDMDWMTPLEGQEYLRITRK